MKKYIKPSIQMIEVESRSLLSGSWEEIPINNDTGIEAKEITPEYLEELFGTGDSW